MNLERSLLVALLLLVFINGASAFDEEQKQAGRRSNKGDELGGRERWVVAAEHGGDGGRKLGPFQLCLVCKCCVNPNTCATMPCCFRIDCQLPNKPFGVCAFVPKTCNCNSC